jgi:hypothetical protein
MEGGGEMNSRTAWLLGMVVVALALCYSVTLAADASQYVLKTKEQALQRALEYSGFTESPGFVVPQADSCVKMMEIKDSTTPFLSDSISGAERWVVMFDSVFLDFGGWAKSTVDNQIKKSYHFVLDPVTGRLLKVYSVYEKPAMDLTPEPSVEASEANLIQNERYVSLVDLVPPVSLYRALDVAVPAEPLTSKEVHACLVMLSAHEGEPKPCWVILARGTPPWPVPFSIPPTEYGSTSPDHYVYTMRCVVDATTGKGMYCQ